MEQSNNLLQKTIDLCKKFGITPARSKGQNFLIDENAYDSVTDAADLIEKDLVMEVGPGLGFLTKKLAQKVKKVFAIELDDKLANALKQELNSNGIKNVEIINTDVLKFEIENLNAKNFKIVANLPYNITSIFLRKFLEGKNRPKLMVLMLQKEVAERIAAKPGNMSLLGISVQFYSDPEIITYVPAQSFWPKPEVDSAIIKLKIKSLRPKLNEEDFFRMVKIGFSAKRKMLKNNLAGGFQISQTEAEQKIKNAGFNPKIRAQDLNVDDWKKIYFEIFK